MNSRPYPKTHRFKKKKKPFVRIKRKERSEKFQSALARKQPAEIQKYEAAFHIIFLVFIFFNLKNSKEELYDEYQPRRESSENDEQKKDIA